MQADPRGAYYTPADIVRLIVENTVGRLVTDRPAILDPACGTGAFLTGAHSYLADRFGHETALNRVCGVDVDKAALAEARKAVPSANLRLGDSLLGINWKRAFPEVMARGGFDAVIGNPPWVSLAGRFGVEAYSAADIERLRGRFGGNSYLPNTFEYFISLGLELTRPGGYLSFIVPDRLGFNRQFEYLRRRLLAETELLLLVHGIRFPGVTADTMVFVCRKGAPGPDAVTESRDSRGLTSSFPQSELREFRRPEDARIARIVRLMESHPVRLSDICDITSGFGGRSELITEQRISDEQIPVLKGDSIERYAVRKAYWFDFQPENLTGRTTDPAKLGASPKILIRKTGSSLIAAYDDSGTYPEQSLYFLFNNRTDMDWRFVLGILNSRLMGVYYRARCLTNPGTIAHAKISDLARLPLPAPDQERHDRLVGLVQAGTHDEIDALVCELYGVQMQDLRAIIG
jgi:hypothetical protein